jgi:hypothetical protein
MYSQEDIFKALQAGTNPEDMIRQFTDNMNAAIAQKKAEDQKKNQAYARKVAKMQAIIDEVFDFMKEFYPSLPITDDLRDGVDAHDLIESLDESVHQVAQLSAMFGDIMNEKKPQQSITIKKAIDSDDALNKFLKSNGLK